MAVESRTAEHESKGNSLEVRFAVRGARTRPWEHVYVTGSLPQLGNWMPDGALPLQRSACDDGSENELWTASLRLDSFPEVVTFRYIVVYFLQHDSEAGKRMSLARWEAHLQPRRILPAIEALKGIARGKQIDQFGVHSGRECVSDGWIRDVEQEYLLRIHDSAFHFYLNSYQTLPLYLKVVPFDVRFSNVYSYETASSATHNHHQHHQHPHPHALAWRTNSVYIDANSKSFEQPTVHDEDEEVSLPDHASFSETTLSILTSRQPDFVSQPQRGVHFRNGHDYFVFRTRSISPQNLAFRIELYADRSGARKRHTLDSVPEDGGPNDKVAEDVDEHPGPAAQNSASSSVQRIAVAYAMPSSMLDTFAKACYPLIAPNQQPIGEVTVHYLVCRSAVGLPSSVRDNMEKSFGRHWKKRKTLEVGHRGAGASYSKCATARENTLHSLRHAASRGADMVEFDVQLSRDEQVLIFHDFYVNVRVANTRQSHESALELREIAVKDLTLIQLRHLHVEGGLSEGDDMDSEEHQPFPLLQQVLLDVDWKLPFNIEVKYPMVQKDGVDECEHFMEKNRYLDAILRVVYSSAGPRRIVFSSFDPDICTLLRVKQHFYPALFLVVGQTTRYVPFLDDRSAISAMAVRFAVAWRLLGLNFHSEELLADSEPYLLAKERGLVVFVWGDDVNEPQNQAYFRKLHVDGIIYDRIGEFEPRRSVFAVEEEAKTALFFNSTSTKPSDRSSQSNRRSSLTIPENHSVEEQESEDGAGRQEKRPAPKRALSMHHQKANTGPL